MTEVKKAHVKQASHHQDVCMTMTNRLKKLTWKITCDCHGPIADEWRLTVSVKFSHKAGLKHRNKTPNDLCFDRFCIFLSQ